MHFAAPFRGFAGQFRRASVFLCLVLLTGALVFGGSPAARADDVPILKGDITDPQSILADSKIQIEDSIKKVKNATGESIWVVFVPTFLGNSTDFNEDGVVNSSDWVQAVANKANLGDTDVIYAVSTSSHEVAIWTSGNSPRIKERDLKIVMNTVIPALKQAQWGQSVLKFNESILAQSRNSGSLWPYILTGAIGLALIGFLVYCAQKRMSFGVKFATESSATGTDLAAATLTDLSISPAAGELLTLSDELGETELSEDATSHERLTEQLINKFKPQPRGKEELLEKYGVIHDKTPQVTKATEEEKEEIYSDYYQRSASREAYGSYYSEGEAAKHDQQINKFKSDKFDNLLQSISSLEESLTGDLKSDADSEALLRQYYEGKTTPQERIKELMKKWER